MNEKIIGYIVISVMCILLSIGISMQMNIVGQSNLMITYTQEENELKSQILRERDEYSRNTILLANREEVLENERSLATQNDAKLEEGRENIEELQKFIGATEVSGTGVVVRLADGQYDYDQVINASSMLVHDADVLGIINELKNAGAEAISINGQRVISTTSIECGGNVININGEKVGAPFEIQAIGLPEQLAGLSRLGGPIDILNAYGVNASIEKMDSIVIPKYAGRIEFEYASAVEY